MATGALMTLAGPASPAVIPGETWVTDGTVNSVVMTDDRVYLGGLFNFVGPNTGGGAALDIGTGIFDANLDRIDGAVRTAVPDGSGGWFLGGDFSYVGDLWRPHLVHIDSSGTPTSWRPVVAGSTVHTLALIGTTLYVGGDFSSLGGVPRSNLGSIDVAMIPSVDITPWDPQPSRPVRTLLASADETTLYVGGDFGSAAGVGRSRVAAFDMATGAITPWNPAADEDVYALALSADGADVYLGGDFTTVGGQPRANIAAVAASDGALRGWNPGTDGQVRALEVAGSTLFVAGDFTVVGAASRIGLAEVATTADATPTAFDAGADGAVNDIAVKPDGTLAIGGTFTTIGGVPRNRLAQIDPATSLTLPWDPNANGAVLSISLDGDTVFAGGEFGSVNGIARQNLAALDSTTGTLDLNWNPMADDEVIGLALSPDEATVYAGGRFVTVAGATHERLVALDATTGVPDPLWAGSASKPVRALDVGNGRLYFGGDFDVANARTRGRLAAVDLATGAIDENWAPTADDTVRALAVAVDGSRVYLGGEFDSISGTTRQEIAAVDAVSGALDIPWNPATNRRVYDLETTASGVLAALGGSGGVLASFDLATGTQQFWVLSDGDVQAVTHRDDIAYAGGHFDLVAGESRTHLFAVDTATGVLRDDWNPASNGDLGILSMTQRGGRVWLGGDFTLVSGRSAQSVAKIDAVLSAGGAAYRDQVLFDGAFGYWRLGEASGTLAVDDADGLDGTYVGDPGLGVPGLIIEGAQSAVAFDGVDDYIALPDSALLNTGGPYEARSIELWFRADDVSPRQVLFEQGGLARGMSLYLDGGRLYGGAWNRNNDGDGTTPWPDTFISAPVSAGDVHHAVLVFDYLGDRFELFIDGASATSTTGIGRLFNHSRDVGVGAMNDATVFHDSQSSGNGFSFGGVIDEVAAYPTPLGSAEVANHYLIGTSGGTGAPSVTIASPGHGEIVAGTVTVAVSATDPQDPAGSLLVEVTADGGTTWTPATWNLANDAYELDWDTTLVGDGSATLTARATDANLNTTVGADVTVTVDNINDAPVVAIVEPTEGATVTGVVTVAVAADDLQDPLGSLNVEISIERGPWQPATWNSAEARYEATWDTTTGPDGPTSIDARATDAAFAVGAAAPVSVTAQNQSYSALVEADLPSAYWRLGDTGAVAVDTMGTQNGTFVGSPVIGQPSLINDAADAAVAFDGIDDGVTIGSNAAINTPGVFSHKTIELWFNAADVTNRAVLYEQGGGARGISIYVDAGALHYGAWNLNNDGPGTPWGPVFGSTPIATDATYHFVLVLDGPAGTLEGFLNGTSLGALTGAGDLHAHGKQAGIGAIYQAARFHDGSTNVTSGSYFTGTIDEVAHYNLALSPDAIATHTLVGTGGGGGSAPLVAIVTPEEGDVVAGLVPITITAIDGQDPIGSLTVEVSTDGGASWQPAAWNAGAQTYQASWDSTLASDGPVTIDARATDSATDTGTDAVDVTVDNIEDAPTVAIAEPAPGAVVSATITVAVDAADVQDPAGSLVVEVSTDGQVTWVPAPWNTTTARYEAIWDTSTQPDGGATVEARATDSALQTSVATPVAVTIENDAYDLQVVADGAVAYWRLAESAGTSAADGISGLDGTYFGTPTLGTPGLISDATNTSVTFDGVDDYVVLPDSPLINTGGPYEARSIELWFRAGDTTSRQVLFDEGGLARGLSLYLDNGSLYAGAWNRPNDGDGTTPWADDVFISAAVATDTTYHVVVVFDQVGDRLELYVNGTSVANASGVGRLFRHSKDAAIGATVQETVFHDGNTSATGFFASAIIDEVALYNNVLSIGQIAGHYAAGS
jgi:hypothetical protein